MPALNYDQYLALAQAIRDWEKIVFPKPFFRDGKMITQKVLSYVGGKSQGIKNIPVLYNDRYGPAIDIGYAYLISMPGV